MPEWRFSSQIIILSDVINRNIQYIFVEHHCQLFVYKCIYGIWVACVWKLHLTCYTFRTWKLVYRYGKSSKVNLSENLAVEGLIKSDNSKLKQQPPQDTAASFWLLRRECAKDKQLIWVKKKSYGKKARAYGCYTLWSTQLPVK